MNNIIASAPTKEKLEKMINEFYASENYIITEENEVYNKKLNKTLDSVKVTYKRKRFYFEFK